MSRMLQDWLVVILIKLRKDPWLDAGGLNNVCLFSLWAVPEAPRGESIQEGVHAAVDEGETSSHVAERSRERQDLRRGVRERRREADRKDLHQVEDVVGRPENEEGHHDPGYESGQPSAAD